MEKGGIRVTFDPATEMASPRFRAIIRATSGRRKRPTSANIKSFSLEFNCRGPHRFRIQKLRPFTNPDDVMMLVRSKFNRLKQEVNAELGIFAGDVVSTLESTRQDDHELRVQLEDLLLIAQKCAEMTPDDFWSKCEGFVQSLDDRRQELPMGILKQAHTRFLFILTRCTRLLQFHQEGAFGEGGHHVLGRHQFSDLGYYPEQTTGLGLKGSLSSNAIKDKLIKKKLHEHGLSSGYQNENFAGHIYSDGSDSDSPGSRERMSSWKKLPSAAEKNQKKSHSVENDNMSPKKPSTVDEGLEVDDESLNNESNTGSEAQQVTAADSSTMICRICDFVIPTLHAESHFKVCSIVDRCDVKGGSVEERLEKIADILEKILEPCTSVTDGMCVGDEHVNSTVSSSTDNIECFPEKSPIMNGDNGLPSVSCNKSPGSMTPRSPLLTAQPSQVDLLLTVKSALSELENLQQIKNLLDIVHCIKGVQTKDYSSLEYLSSYLEDLNDVIDNRKVDALIVETFGRRIEKLLQEKFILLCAQIDDGNKDSSGLDLDDDSSVDNDKSHGSSSHPLSAKLKDRTSIEDFEIIKPVSRGAFGRVFLAKKRVTGDLFAIKVLKKADMIRKNAVESILAERNILISIRNPFVVRFYYSFTCRENLYLVMEYLNGGDLYSLLRNLGCLEEEMARTYVAELVLALEYLHSQSVIHRDLKPDNLLIARNGHIKLTDFGLSKVGLINSTDDLSGPDVSSAALLDEHKPMPASVRAEIREQRRKQSAVGTPDYLAPEILLGMTHGQTADWWSVGVILFELLVGIPPFNAGHPQKIFDNIMNRDIPWPQVPEELSYDAYDLIDKLLMQNPVQRLGATGAGEVKSHPFFKSINWDMLAKQKAAFIPSTEGEDDTSYFACRHDWNPDDVQIQTPLHYDDSTDSGSLSCSSSPYSCANDEDEDEFGSMAEFGAPKKYSFSNFSFKNISQLANINYDLITKCNEDEANAKSSCEKTET